MLENNNKEVINKLSKRSLKVNKMRNIFAVIAIALTTLLITTVIAGEITFFNTNKLYQVVSYYGIDADGYFNVDDVALEKLKSNSNVDEIGVTLAGSDDYIRNKEIDGKFVALTAALDKNAYKMRAIEPIEGNYPKNDAEVLAPTWVLDVLGIEKKVGEKVTLEIVIKGEVERFEFNLCGYYESLVARGTGTTAVFVTEDFITKNNSGIVKEDGAKQAFVTLKNVNKNTSYETVQSEMDSIMRESGAAKAKVHPKYDTTDSNAINSDDIKQIVAVAMAIVLVIFTGYLIIFNIFHISISKDIKFYGLLKTIGTTSKQLKKIIVKQALTLSIIGIPFGLVLGYAVAAWLLPIALSFTIFGNVLVVSKSPLIFILAILFSLLTVYISCSKPGKMAGKVSPIEAVRYVSVDTNYKKKSKRGTNGAKIYKMAWSNIIKSKKRVILSVLSISLSAVMVIFVVNASLGISPEAHADTQMVSDVHLNNNITHFYGRENYEPITQEIIDEVKSIDGVNDVRPVYSVINPNEDGTYDSFGVEFALDGKLKEEVEIAERSGKRVVRYSYLGLMDNYMKAEIVGLNAERLEEETKKLTVIDGELNEEKFKEGKYIIYYVSIEEPCVLKAGDILPLTLKIRDGNGNVTEIKEQFEIMAIVADRAGGWVASNLEAFNIEENKFKKLFPDYNNYIKKLDIDFNDDFDLAEADKLVSEVVNKSGNDLLGISSKNFYMEGMEELQMILIIVGGVVAVILGVIGAINVANTMITSILARKIEFAMLESIGMTKKQIKKMILFEGLYYAALTCAVIVPLGLVAAMVAPMMLPLYGGFDLVVYIASVLIAMLIILSLMMTLPLMGYNSVDKESIVERLRGIE